MPESPRRAVRETRPDDASGREPVSVDWWLLDQGIWPPAARELSYVDEQRLRDEAVRALRFGPRSRALFPLWCLGTGLLAMILLPAALTRIGFPVGGPFSARYFVVGSIGMVAFGFLASAGVAWLRRKRTSRTLRRWLNAHGYVVCTACGYWLRGVHGTVCPECGYSAPRPAQPARADFVEAPPDE